MKIRLVVVIGLMALAMTACGGGRTAPTVSTTTGDNGGSDLDPIAVAEGQAIFNGTCIACHGEGGIGVEGLGKPLPGSEYVASLSDAELVEFIKTGRDTTDPLNTTGIAMPAYGGNPNLTDEQLGFVVQYIRSLN